MLSGCHRTIFTVLLRCCYDSCRHATNFNATVSSYTCPYRCSAIEHNSYAARAQAALNQKEPWRTVPHSTIVPTSAGGVAALAHAGAFSVVLPYVPPLGDVIEDEAQRIQAAAKAAAGIIEKGSYAERAVLAAS